MHDAFKIRIITCALHTAQSTTTSPNATLHNATRWRTSIYDLVRRLALSALLVSFDSLTDQIIFALFVSTFFTLWWREVSPSWDECSDRVGYFCGYFVVVCVLG